jgi:hypothetical protein
MPEFLLLLLNDIVYGPSAILDQRAGLPEAIVIKGAWRRGHFDDHVIQGTAYRP